MEEPAGGPNHGRRKAADVGAITAHEPLGADEHQAAEFMRSGGWTIVHAKDGSRAGVSSHGVNQFTVVHPDEHVDHEALRPMVEQELGFSYEQVRSVYRQGRKSATQRELRARIDARLLALSRSGANLALLGGLLGFKVEADSHCEPLDNALARARAAESTPENEEAL
jgi:hypothetical protein